MAEVYVYFFCEDGAAIQNLVETTEKTGERQHLPLHITAAVPSNSPDAVAEFILNLANKRKSN